MSELRQRMIDEMTLRGFSPRTHESYIGAVSGLARYYNQPPPDRLNTEQVRQYLLHLERERHLSWNSLNVAASGLRVSEAIALRVHDIDSARMTIRVVQGKGRKDRYTILSPRLLENLRQYWKQYHPKEYLFEGSQPQRHISESVPQKVYNSFRPRRRNFFPSVTFIWFLPFPMN